MKKSVIIRIALSSIFILTASLCLAGPPFGTDDPEPVDFRHWEYYLSSQDQFQPGFSTGTLPHFEFNYGLIRNCQIHFVLPLNYNSYPDKVFQYGYGNTEIGFKFRFYRSKDESLQIGTFPIFEVPTVRNPYFTNNRVQVYLPVWIQKSWNKFTTYGGGGLWINPGDNNKNWMFAGWELQYDFSKFLTFGGELFYKGPSTINGRQLTGFNIGGFINFSDKIHFIFSAGHSITGESTTTAYAGLLITI